MEIAEHRFLALTTYGGSGEPVTTRVWVVPLTDGRIGFWLTMGSGETSRLLRDPRVTVQPSTRSGQPRAGTAPTTGAAQLVRSGRSFEEVQGRTRRKYGLAARLDRLRHRLGPAGRQGLRYADTVALVRLDDHPPTRRR